MKYIHIILMAIFCMVITGPAAGSIRQETAAAINVKDFGARGDGVTDDTIAIKNAVLSLKETGGTVIFPPGVYVVGVPTVASTGYLDNYFIPLVSNLVLEGNGAESVIKVKDNFLNNVKDESSNAHILAGKGLRNVTIRKLTFDGNGRNNLTPSGHIRNALFITLDAENITIEDNVFLNCAGHNMIVTNGKGALVRNNRLQNGGHYVGTQIENRHNADYSFMYIASTDSMVSGNLIEQQDPEIALRGWTGGIEVHGSNSTVTDNTVRGCNPAIYIANDTDIANVNILRNSFEKCLRGVAFWNTELTLKNVTIADNTISLYRPPFRGGDLVYAIGQENGSVSIYTGASANGGYVENLIIKNNRITSASSAQSPAIQGIRLHSLKTSVIENNVIDGLSDTGIALIFFKQKTAYEIIAGDWSSDVCSSDLVLAAKAALYIQTHGSATKPAKPYFIKNVLIEKNEFGNTHKEVLDSNGNVAGNECKGHMLTGIVLAGYNKQSKVESLVIRDNSYTNLIWKTYGTADPLAPEHTNPGLKSVPDVIQSAVKPLTDRQLFGNEIIVYPDGSRYKCTRQGYLSSKTGTMTGEEGRYVVACDNSTGLRVGMYLVISGAGRSGADLYTFIRSIDNNRITLTDPIVRQGGVTAAAYRIMQPVLVALR